MPRGGRLTVPKRTPSPGSRSVPRRTILMLTSSVSPRKIARNQPGATPTAAAARLRLDENKFELYPYEGQGPTLKLPAELKSWEKGRVVAAGAHTSLRRRLFHLPLLGGLLAGTDRRARHLSPLSRSCRGFPGNPTAVISARHSIFRQRRARIFRCGRNLSRS